MNRFINKEKEKKNIITQVKITKMYKCLCVCIACERVCHRQTSSSKTSRDLVSRHVMGSLSQPDRWSNAVFP